MSFYCESYRGYIITLVGASWYIQGYPSVIFISLASAQNYIDKLLS